MAERTSFLFRRLLIKMPDIIALLFDGYFAFINYVKYV